MSQHNKQRQATSASFLWTQLIENLWVLLADGRPSPGGVNFDLRPLVCAVPPATMWVIVAPTFTATHHIGTPVNLAFLLRTGVLRAVSDARSRYEAAGAPGYPHLYGKRKRTLSLIRGVYFYRGSMQTTILQCSPRHIESTMSGCSRYVAVTFLEGICERHPIAREGELWGAFRKYKSWPTLYICDWCALRNIVLYWAAI